jgi:hypothetical protein
MSLFIIFKRKQGAFATGLQDKTAAPEISGAAAAHETTS